MALRSMRLGSKKEKGGARSLNAIRHRRVGQSVEDVDHTVDVPRAGPGEGPDSNMGYIDVTHNPDGSIATDPDTIPKAL